jgi:putative transcriptional regulator
MLDNLIHNVPPAAGKLLISEPFLPDSNFRRSVILLCEHEDNGSLGFILNRRLKIGLKEVMEIDVPNDFPLYLGGPVQNNTLHFIHRQDSRLSSSHSIGNGVFWGGDFAELLPLLEAGSIKVEDVRFFLGYSGWGNGQLQNEIDAKSWIVAPGSEGSVFEMDDEKIWKNILESMGPGYRILSNYPENPFLN